MVVRLLRRRCGEEGVRRRGAWRRKVKRRAGAENLG